MIILARFRETFDGCKSLTERLGDTKLRFAAPMNSVSGLNRPHHVTRNKGISDPVEKKKIFLDEDITENMFEANIENVAIDTYDYVLVEVDDSMFNPVKEYLFHLPGGYLGASLISQTSNPHVIQEVKNSFDINFNP